ncbi:MAG: ribosomal protein [Actinomycetota bacterium]|jgi:small subunit ribosomal protein S18
MTSKRNKARSARDTNRKFKKKANPLKGENLEYIDYKDVNLLQKFITDRSKIRGQRMAGTTVQDQREIATAIKNAREMALLPYTKRTVSTRAPRPGADRRDEETVFQPDENTPAAPESVLFEGDAEFEAGDDVVETTEGTEA